MIRFCDKEVYTIREGDMSRIQMFGFFLNDSNIRSRGGGHLEDVLMVFDEQENYKGIITYERLLNCSPGNEMLRDVLIISDAFWEEGRAYFAEHPDELMPVMDKKGNVLGFCWDDKKANNGMFEQGLKMLESCYEDGNLISIGEVYPNVMMACFCGCNEYVWKSYQFFLKTGLQVCVLGEEWEWFGIKRRENYYDFPKWAKLFIYAEDRSYVYVKNHKVSYGFPNWTVEFREMQRRHTYQVWTNVLEQKGIRYCRCMIPQTLTYDKMTEQEIRNILQPVYINDEKYMQQEFTEGQIEALRRSMDNEEELEFLLWEEGDLIEKKHKGLELCFDSGIPCYKCEGSSYRKRIYLLGICTVLNGYLVKNKIPGILQEYVEEKQYEVVAFINLSTREHLESILMKIPIRIQDIVVLLDTERVLKGLDKWGTEIDLREIYEKKGRRTWIYDAWIAQAHINSHGNRAIAEVIYEKYVKGEIERLKAVSDKTGFLIKGEILNEENLKQIRDYIEKVEKIREKEKLFVMKENVEMDSAQNKMIGSIIMNCNPFTYGHQYLIEYAAGKVDLLYIFVVEEDRSEFPFKERINMVKAGCEHLSNVCVVPSGNWVLSYETFSAYFVKSVRQEQKVDARTDLEIFARYIAPQLGITYRFVGEEPTDKVTRQYNEQMKEILADFEIEVEEVPRKKVDGNVISASYVRKCLKEGQAEEIKRFVPESTWKCLVASKVL